MNGYLAYVLEKSQRNKVLAFLNTFASRPHYEEVIAHHVTYAFGVSINSQEEFDDFFSKMPSTNEHDGITKIEVLEYARNNAIEALRVSIDNVEHQPSGKYFHLTCGINRGLSHQDLGGDNPQKIKPVDSEMLFSRPGFSVFSKKVSGFSFYAEPKFVVPTRNKS